MDMDAVSRNNLCTLVHLLSWLSLLSIPLFPVEAQEYPNNPSTNWTLSDYFYYERSNSRSVPIYFSYLSRYKNFTVCNDQSSSFLLLNEQEKGLYCKYTGLHSAHINMPYTVYFGLYFVTPEEDFFLNDNTNSVPSYYLSLIAKVDDPYEGHVVWTANPDKPFSQHACLHLNDSNLTLVDYHDRNRSSADVVWQISTGASDVSFAINFEGNIFLFTNTTDPPYVPLWESFRYPSDTLMVLQVLEKQSTLTVNASATSKSGTYTLAIANGRLVLYARIGQLIEDGESPYGSPYWVWPNINSSIPANDKTSFAAFCWDPVNQLRLYAGSNRSSDDSTEYRGMVSPQFCSTIPNNSDRAMQITGLDQSINATYVTFLRLEADGDLHAYTVDNTTSAFSITGWRSFYSVFNNTPCDLPLYCGSYGMCDPQREDGSFCTCNYSGDPKLVFADQSNNKLGCTPRDSSIALLWDQNIYGSGQAIICATDSVNDCTSEGSECEVKFFTLNNVHYFSLNFTKSYDGVHDSDGCKDECKKNCSCTAAFWNQSAGKCFLVLGRVGTIRQHGTMQAFIKHVQITKKPPTVKSFSLWKLASPLLAAMCMLLVGCIIYVYWRTRRARTMNDHQEERMLLLSVLDSSKTEEFTWKQMKEYTCGFSDLLGGGGFGRVFRGALPNGTAIAVKQLDEDGSLGQGDKEFIAEVSTLSRIHHAHLVHMIGFCLEGTHSILVYEYMENGSLDAWLFKSHAPLVLQEDLSMNSKDKGKGRLPWKARFQIALGTAKGLAYLHEECEERIIHMDLKPQNILLGRNFTPKISDFGMSRRTGREQTSVMTVMRGTPGYLAPEWLLDCAITEKCDVYSFGIVLLEIVSGRKVKDLKAVKQKLSMRPLREGVMLELLDEKLRYYGSDVNEEEAVRMVEVALMCVRRDPTKRPAMSRVVLMLEGKEETLLDWEDEEELLTYPSPMNKTMRMLQLQQGSLSDSGSGSSSMWWNPGSQYQTSYKTK